MNAVLYVDGSCLKGKRYPAFFNGYGAVLLVNDQHYEFSEGLKVSQDQMNSHEHYAFLHGLELAESHGVDLSKLTVFCDDQVFGYAAFWLHPGNYSGQGEGVRSSVATLKRATSNQKEKLLHFLTHGRVTKLKGHQCEVYQERVDYLARHAARKANGDDSPLKSYEDWLREGFVKFSHSLNTLKRVYSPFVDTKDDE